MASGSRQDPLVYSEKDFFSKYVLSSTDSSDCKSPNTSDLISMPNSNAFIDLNGDCLADLVLTRQTGNPEDTTDVKTYYEIYSQLFVDGKVKFCLAAQDGQLVSPTDVRTGTKGSSKMPFMEFADFNRDGMTDIAFMSETGTLSILFNQLSAPGSKATNLCNDVGNTRILKNRKVFPTFPFTAEQNGVV